LQNAENAPTMITANDQSSSQRVVVEVPEHRSVFEVVRHLEQSVFRNIKSSLVHQHGGDKPTLKRADESLLATQAYSTMATRNNTNETEIDPTQNPNGDMVDSVVRMKQTSPVKALRDMFEKTAHNMMKSSPLLKTASPKREYQIKPMVKTEVLSPIKSNQPTVPRSSSQSSPLQRDWSQSTTTAPSSSYIHASRYSSSMGRSTPPGTPPRPAAQRSFITSPRTPKSRSGTDYVSSFIRSANSPKHEPKDRASLSPDAREILNLSKRASASLPRTEDTDNTTPPVRLF